MASFQIGVLFTTVLELVSSTWYYHSVSALVHSGFVQVSDIISNLWISSLSDIINSWRGACGVMVIVVGNGHGDTSSNPGQDWLHFT